MQAQEVEWLVNAEGQLQPHYEGEPLVWAPLPGAQQEYLDCPVKEALLEGTRGGGKTTTSLMDFLQGVGQGYGNNWRGLILRRHTTEFQHLVEECYHWFNQVCPEAEYNSNEKRWRFPDGEVLWLAYLKRESDYYHYHGNQYSWILFEELTNWPDPAWYKRFFSTLRSPDPRVPLKLRATANPYGPGHNWVKHRFGLPVPPGKTVGRLVTAPGEPERVAIHSDFRENLVLMHANPDYEDNLRAAAKNESELRAWLHGSWDIVAGGMFDDLWEPEVHVVPDFDPRSVPRGWRIDRAFDWGQTKPFSVGWYAESNGEPMILPNGRLLGTVRGDLFRFAEWYGSTGRPNEGLQMLNEDIGRGIRKRQVEMGIDHRVVPGPADASIFNDWEPGKSVAGDMLRVGVQWLPSDKRQHSRVQGWQSIRRLLAGAFPPPGGGPREAPGLFVSARCHDFRRTMPVLPRSGKWPDDADTEAEDHVADEVRYRCFVRRREATSRSMW